MGRKKKTQEEFIAQVNAINANISITGKYTGANNRIDCECSICNNKWKPIANSLLMKSGCPVCANLKSRLTTNEFKNKLLNNNVEIISEFNTYKNDIRCKCKVCNYEWNGNPKSLIYGTGCPVCGGTMKKSHEQFREQVEKLVDDEYSVLGIYTNAYSKIKFQHNICHNIFEMQPSNFIHGQRCPICNKSKGENSIRLYLENNKIEYVPQKGFNGLIGVNNGQLSYDFHLPLYNLLIEYQGEFHNGTAKLQSNEKYINQKEHDKRKKEYAELHNIELLEIWYWDFEKIETILENKLKNKGDK